MTAGGTIPGRVRPRGSRPPRRPDRCRRRSRHPGAARVVVCRGTRQDVEGTTACTSAHDARPPCWRPSRSPPRGAPPRPGRSSTGPPPRPPPPPGSQGPRRPARRRYAQPDPNRPRITLSFDLADDLATVKGTEKVVFTPDRPVSEVVFRLTANTGAEHRARQQDRDHRRDGHAGRRRAHVRPRGRRPGHPGRAAGDPARPRGARRSAGHRRGRVHAHARPGRVRPLRPQLKGRTRGGGAASPCSPGSAVSAGTRSRCCRSPPRAPPARPPRSTSPSPRPATRSCSPAACRTRRRTGATAASAGTRSPTAPGTSASPPARSSSPSRRSPAPASSSAPGWRRRRGGCCPRPCAPSRS